MFGEIIARIMAFFGITSFGPQNTFIASHSKDSFIHTFDDSDIQKSWVATSKDIKQTAKRSEIDSMLVQLYKGPLPTADQALIDKGFNVILPNKDSCITYPQFLSTIKKLQGENEKIIRLKDDRVHKCAEPSQSNHTYRSKIKSHNIQTDFKLKQSYPLLSSQELGWEKTEYKSPVSGKKGSEITKFAAELVKNGIYY